jgi:hypothetical protein
LIPACAHRLMQTPSHALRLACQLASGPRATQAFGLLAGSLPRLRADFAECGVTCALQGLPVQTAERRLLSAMRRPLMALRVGA